MNWTGKVCPFAIRNLIKIEISKMTALRDTLVYDSDNWSHTQFPKNNFSANVLPSDITFTLVFFWLRNGRTGELI